jgi:D-glycero-D-manno-heptose 1,7-bisphosphate phosphatase
VTVAVFLDRDGILDEPVVDPVDGRPESPLRADDVRLVDGAAEGCRRLTDAGFLLVVVSNQPGAAKGKATMDDVWAVHARVAALLDDEGVEIDDWRYCFHHPDAVADELRGPCDCRKPAPGMLLAAAAAHGIDLPASWMIGDRDTDVEAGARAGCRTVLVEHPGSAHRRFGDAGADVLSHSLRGAARLIAAP